MCRSEAAVISPAGEGLEAAALAPVAARAHQAGRAQTVPKMKIIS